MNPKRAISVKRKMPISFILIMIWMGFMIVKILFKLFNVSKLERNAFILGETVAYINYFVDALILLFFIILLCLFILRKRYAWKYFIGLMIFVIIGNIIGLFYLPKVLSLVPAESQLFVLGTAIITTILIILFYLVLIYIVYRRRRYFDR